MSKPSTSWLFKMAWRDSRRNLGRLLLFVSSIVIGIAALVAINSFSENLQADIDRQAQSLLGADFSVESNQPIPDSLLQIIEEKSTEKSEVVKFASMASFPKTGDTRLSRIIGLEGGFPYYGKMITEPANAAIDFREKKQALVDKTLMIQFNVQQGDSIKVGKVTFEIAGQLNSAPGSTGISSSTAPAVYIPMKYMAATELIQMGSRIEYEHFYQFPKDFDLENFEKEMRPPLREVSARTETVQRRKRNVSEAFSSGNNFLNLVGFIALLLGCIGVASSVHIYVKDKISTVSILRCLGASGRQAFLIYLIQIIAMGFIGSLIGALIGSGIQVLVPEVMKDFLPLEDISSNVSASAIFQGVITGMSIAVLFALLPLLSIRKVSPLRSLRASYEADTSGFDPLRWVIYFLIFLFVAGFTYLQTGGIMEAIAFPIGIGIGLLILAGIAKLVVWLVRKFFPTRWSFVARQSIANLYRPNNQTLTLIVSIGLGTAFISTLFFTQDLLLQRLELTSSENQPNIVVFNIQKNNRQGVVDLTRSMGFPIIEEIPVVTMRLEELDGVTKAERMRDTTSKVRRWTYTREYRVTYRDTLNESEEIIKGEWIPERMDKDGPVPISVSSIFAENAKAKIGSKIRFNVQGVDLETEIASIRKNLFNRVSPTFGIVFPKGVLEKTPQLYALVSRVDTPEKSAAYQRELVKAHPSVSAIDLTTILQTVDDILGKVSFVIQFMALFSILTGLLVLISSVVLSRYQRIQESVLLRTLGAKSRQILWINALEYFTLGSLATLTGIGLGLVGTYFLATKSFKLEEFSIDYMPAFWIFFIITTLTVLIGLLNSREVLTKPPLEVLRKEL